MPMIFVTAFSVLFPLFAKIALGAAIRKIGLLSEKALAQMNNVVFRVLLPALLFVNIYQSDFASISSFDFLYFSLVLIIALFALTLLIVPRLEGVNARRAVIVQGINRSNFIFFGLPMAQTLYGGASKAVASLLIGILVPILNVISVFALEYFRGERPSFLKILKSIVRNPILIGGALGLLTTSLGITLPLLIEDFLVDVSAIATPLALILLGCSVTFASMKENRRALAITIGGRLIVIPVIGISLALLLGFRGLELTLLMALFASPTAVSSFTMAQQMGGDSELAAQVVVMSTIFSLFTLFGWISLLMGLNFF